VSRPARAIGRARLAEAHGLARAARRLIVLALVPALVIVSGCGGGARPAAPVDNAERAQLLIESGNQAYSAGNYPLAARRYAAAAVIREDDPAAYYGLGMALAKLGRDEDARAAYARARELSRR
jgi:tetratricopeptide (TPR) repeat protein